MEDDSNKGGFLLGVIVTLIVVSLIWGIGKRGKYEGKTAKEWFDYYDWAEANYEEEKAKYQDLYDCIEPYALESGDISANDLYYDCF
jgi:hypothetical protein